MIFFLCAFPCLGKGEEELIIEEFGKIILQQDKDSLLYDQVLKIVGTYIKNQDKDSFLATKTYLEEAIGQFEERIEECITSRYEMTQSFRELLMEYQIEPEEYQMHADLRSSYLVSYQDSTSLLLSILEAQENEYRTEELFEKIYEQNVAVQECMRKSHFYEINYFFCEWEEDAIEQLEEEVISKLQSFTAQGQPWETKKEVIEQKISIYLEKLEDVVEQLSEEIGEEQEKLYQMEAEIGS